MRNIVIFIFVIAAIGYVFFDKKEKQTSNDLRSQEFKEEENTKIMKEVDLSVSADVVAKINGRTTDNSSDQDRRESLDRSDIEDVEKIVRGLSSCILKKTCQDSKSEERYYDPNEGSYQRSLVKSLDFLREQKEMNEPISLGDKDLEEVLSISNDEVQASALLLADSLSFFELIARNCSKVSDANILNTLYMVAKGDEKERLESCLNSFFERQNTQALFDTVTFMSAYSLEKSFVEKTTNRFCPFIKEQEESAKRVGLKYKSVLEKYDLSCP